VPASEIDIDMAINGDLDNMYRRFLSAQNGKAVKVGRCRLAVLRPVMKARVVSALETRILLCAFNVCFFNLRHYIKAVAMLEKTLQWRKVGRCRSTLSNPH